MNLVCKSQYCKTKSFKLIKLALRVKYARGVTLIKGKTPVTTSLVSESETITFNSSVEQMTRYFAECLDSMIEISNNKFAHDTCTEAIPSLYLN